MKQIKTIEERKTENFDDKVNACLRDGWRIKRRTITADLVGSVFIAQLEKELGTCDDCRFKGRMLTDEPCIECGANYEKWQAEEEEEESDHG